MLQCAGSLVTCNGSERQVHLIVYKPGSRGTDHVGADLASGFAAAGYDT